MSGQDPRLPPPVPESQTHLAQVDRFLDLHRLAYKHSPMEVSGVTDSDRWHRHTKMNFYPLLFTEAQLKSSFGDYVRQHLLREMPPFPRIFRFDRATLTFGSCFASRIRDYLKARFSVADNVWIPDGLNNSYSLLSYFEWGLLGTDAVHSVAYVKTDDGRIVNWVEASKPEHEMIRHSLVHAGGFVFTLGMTEVWRHKTTKTVFWRGVPHGVFDADLHEPYQSSFADNLDNVRRLVALIRQECGDVPIVFTVSPVPLLATFRGTSTIVADCASKSILRAVVDELLRDGAPNVHYWPSFEMVRWIGAHIERATFTLPEVSADGKILHDSLHIPDWVVSGIVETFIETAFHPQG